MRIVLDTNVLVAALLSPGGPPAQVVALLTPGGPLVPCIDDRILAEYGEVLGRPRFAGRIAPAIALATVAAIETAAVRVASPVPAAPFTLPDPDDQPFLEVAVAGRADAIVTGNARHFPAACGVRVLAPAAILAIIAPPA